MADLGCDVTLSALYFTAWLYDGENIAYLVYVYTQAVAYVLGQKL